MTMQEDDPKKRLEALNQIADWEKQKPRTHDELGKQLVDKPRITMDDVGLKIGKYGSLPDGGAFPTTTQQAKVHTFTGWRMTQDPSNPVWAEKSYTWDIQLPKSVHWSWRLWRVLCLPYDLVIFIKTGRLRFL